MKTATAGAVRAFLRDEDKLAKDAAIWDYERSTLARARSSTSKEGANWRRPLLNALAFAGLSTWPMFVPPPAAPGKGMAGWDCAGREQWFVWALWQGLLPYRAAVMCVSSLAGVKMKARRARPNPDYGYYYFSHATRCI